MTLQAGLHALTVTSVDADGIDGDSTIQTISIGGSLDVVMTFATATETSISGDLILLSGLELVSAVGNVAGGVTTFTTNGAVDLTTQALVAVTRGGIALTSVIVTSATTFTAIEPVDGLELGVNHDVILEVTDVI